MRTRLKLLPGQRGTRKLTREYGDRLVCVRYRYDAIAGRRLKTVELIVSEVPWQRSDEAVVRLRIGNQETDLRLRAKGAGGSYDGKRGLWKLPMREVRRLGLQSRVVE